MVFFPMTVVIEGNVSQLLAILSAMALACVELVSTPVPPTHVSNTTCLDVNPS